ncbi:3'-5' exoribonuclease domain-containing protein [Pseudoalteromonas sp. S3431]|uniref:3'-5' exoribonuclease domain-containing protein n=1 Tax=Pseudoalteromonas sp. S3431 TaxID=579537 RepID=UPI0004A01A93|nr:3'-5' exoribonuclease [Pseudoalteromonas sp. S3431]KDC51048.1 hypothetical protein DO88_16550 [Pseudoalteromonas sp. S3431]
MNNVMVHLTRLDTRPSAVVVEIAAVFFNPHTGVIGADFHEVISSEEQELRYGTIKESFNSQWKFYSSNNSPDCENWESDINYALVSFVEWLCQIELIGDRIIWSTGDDFTDAGILHQLILDYIGKSGDISGRYWYSSSTMDLNTLFRIVTHNIGELGFNAFHSTDIVKLKAKAAIDMMQALEL